MTKAIDLNKFEISRERGFLASYDVPDIPTPHETEEIKQLALRLPQLIPTGRIRQHIESLPALDLSELCGENNLPLLRTVMVHYAFLTQAYVWGEPTSVDKLPACLAVPMWQLGAAVGQPPLLTYSHYVLDNWDRFDRSKSIDLDNIYMIQPFLSGQDEAWFVLIHVAIEAAAGAILAEFPGLISATVERDDGAIEAGLSRVISGWEQVNAIFDRMPERCDPYVYFNRVRPWIHGWKDNPALKHGIIYEGVQKVAGKPQLFRGQTGSQSSIVPAMDALLKINHAADPLREYLDELHIYRPPAHRRFIDAVRLSPSLRAVVETGQPAVKEAYNDTLEQLAKFRSKHLEYAASYINQQSKKTRGNDTEVGTGGTPFMKYLKKHRDEVNAQRL